MLERSGLGQAVMPQQQLSKSEPCSMHCMHGGTCTEKCIVLAWHMKVLFVIMLPVVCPFKWHAVEVVSCLRMYAEGGLCVDTVFCQ